MTTACEYKIFSIYFDNPSGFNYRVAALDSSEAVQKAIILAKMDMMKKSADAATKEAWDAAPFTIDTLITQLDTVWVVEL